MLQMIEQYPILDESLASAIAGIFTGLICFNFLLATAKHFFNKGTGSIYRYYIEKFHIISDYTDLFICGFIFFVSCIVFTYSTKAFIIFYALTIILGIVEIIEKKSSNIENNRRITTIIKRYRIDVNTR